MGVDTKRGTTVFFNYRSSCMGNVTRFRKYLQGYLKQNLLHCLQKRCLYTEDKSDEENVLCTEKKRKVSTEIDCVIRKFVYAAILSILAI